MVQLSAVRARYERSSSDELRGLAAAGEESFTADAWRALSDEIARRQLTIGEAQHSDREGAGDAVSRLREHVRRISPVGVRGWLAVFMVLILLSGPAPVILTYVHATRGNYLLAAMAGTAFALNLCGVVLTGSSDPRAPRFWVAYLTTGAILDAVGRFGGAPELRIGAGLGLLGLVWVPYWLESKRVRATFRAPAFAPPELEEAAHLDVPVAHTRE